MTLTIKFYLYFLGWAFVAIHIYKVYTTKRVLRPIKGSVIKTRPTIRHRSGAVDDRCH